MIAGLTYLGVAHTLISLVALSAGLIALVNHREISSKNAIGKLYMLTTFLTCLSGFGIYQHGGFGNAHILGIITLVVLGLAWFAEQANKPLGKWSPTIAMLSFSLTFLFHWIPAFTETFTRLPAGAPLAKSVDDPLIKTTIGICFIIFLLGAMLQVWLVKKN
jgi:uncharacterized membrane protein